MLTILFLVMMCMVFGRLGIFAVRATWGITKFIFGIVLLPLFLLGLVFSGFIMIVFPILIIAGIAALFASAV